MRLSALLRAARPALGSWLILAAAPAPANWEFPRRDAQGTATLAYAGPGEIREWHVQGRGRQRYVPGQPV